VRKVDKELEATLKKIEQILSIQEKQAGELTELKTLKERKALLV